MEPLAEDALMPLVPLVAVDSPFPGGVRLALSQRSSPPFLDSIGQASRLRRAHLWNTWGVCGVYRAGNMNGNRRWSLERQTGILVAAERGAGKQSCVVY